MAVAASASASSSFVSTSIFSSEFKVSRTHNSSLPITLPYTSSKNLSLIFPSIKRRHRFEIASISSSPSPVQDVVDTDKPLDYDNLAAELEHASPLRIIDEALRIFGNDIAIAFSGAEDVALIEYAHLTGRPFRVFSLDTGRLNPETYAFFDKVEKHYNIHMEYTFPEADEVQKLVREKGLFSFYTEGHHECCQVRKVGPLRKTLKNLRAWITGQRKDQSPGTRAHIPTVHLDPSFSGLHGGPNSLVKWNPLANMKSNHLWSFLRALQIPVNSLHSKGFVSIGCQPCTRAVQPGQHEREGRWWWESAQAKECGLHKSNADISSSAGGAPLVHHVNGVGRRDEDEGIFESGDVEVVSRVGMEEMVGERRREEAWLVVLYAPWCRFCRAMEKEFVLLGERLVGSGVRVGKFRGDGEDREFAERELGFKSFPTVLFFPGYSCRPIKYSSEKRDADSLMAFVNAVK